MNISKKESQLPILGYYKLRGWGGPIRLMLAYLKIEHIDKLYPEPTPNPKTGMGSWGLDKFNLGLDFPNIPYWIDSVVKLTETKAILKHIARLKDPSLLGSSLEQEGKANMVEEVLWDMWIVLTKICMDHTEKSKSEFINQEAMEKLKLLERFLGDNLFTVGNQVTYVDFLFYEVLQHYHTFGERKLLDPFPKLREYLTRFESIPEISKCLKSPQFLSVPCFSYKFKSKL